MKLLQQVKSNVPRSFWLSRKTKGSNNFDQQFVFWTRITFSFCLEGASRRLERFHGRHCRGSVLLLLWFLSFFAFTIFLFLFFFLPLPSFFLSLSLVFLASALLLPSLRFFSFSSSFFSVSAVCLLFFLFWPWLHLLP
jgi:hypothetical protein